MVRNVNIKTKVEIQLNTDGTWEVVRFLSGPTKQVKLGTKEPLFAGGIRRQEYPKTKSGRISFKAQDALDNARRVRKQQHMIGVRRARQVHREARRHDWSNTTRQIQTCRGCGHPGVNIRTCNGDGTHRAAKLFRRLNPSNWGK